MKKTILTLLTLAFVLALSLTLTACGGTEEQPTAAATEAETPAPDAPTEAPDTDAPTAAPTEAPDEEPTEAPTDAPTEPPTEAPTEPETEPETAAPLTDGIMVYHEDFESYGTVTGHDDTVKALGWTVQTMDDDWAYSDWTAQLSIEEGRLYVHNYCEDKEDPDYFKGTDGYMLMLDEDYMKRVSEYGDYTLQYDVTYTGAGNYKRYIAIVTEYGGDVYHSFHFRVGGYGNNQTHLGGSWYTQDKSGDGSDLSAATTKNTDTTTTIANKLLGITADIADDSAIANFKDVTVTIRIRHSKTGYDIYMKTAENPDFVLVSRSCDDSAGYAEFLDTEEYACAVALKPGGTINGWVDNISLWTGHGDKPADTTVTYNPAA